MHRFINDLERPIGTYLRAGLVDECSFFVAPAVVGGGTRGLPPNVRLQLELIEGRRFGNGMVYLRYRSDPDQRQRVEMTPPGS